ncbi:MAG: type II secretion system F family protein [Acidisphaera sp.]|nr:type II secretion system F family protein [Acidisphaera sp.]
MNTLLLQIMAAGLPLLGGCGWMLTREIRRQDRLAARFASVQGSSRRRTVAEVRASDSSPLPLRLIALLGTTIARSGLLSTSTVANLEQTLISAGFRQGGNGLGLFVGFKLLFLLCLPVGTMAILHNFNFSMIVHHMILAASAVLGLLMPDYGVRWMRKRYLASVQRGLPDALDMMVICSEAGLGLEPSITRVAQEIASAHAAVANELALTANELRITTDTRTALINAGTRTGLESIKRLGSTLVQTMQYGTPLSQALRTLSAEMRQEMLTAFEEKAARLPVLLTVPMILFILPCVFLVVGGPAMIQVLAVMSH